jgi:hypothetical protein
MICKNIVKPLILTWFKLKYAPFRKTLQCKRGHCSIFSPKKVIVMHVMGLKNLHDTLPEVLGLDT